jgi:hypothetical protein
MRASTKTVVNPKSANLWRQKQQWEARRYHSVLNSAERGHQHLDQNPQLWSPAQKGQKEMQPPASPSHSVPKAGENPVQLAERLSRTFQAADFVQEVVVWELEPKFEVLGWTSMNWRREGALSLNDLRNSTTASAMGPQYDGKTPKKSSQQKMV